MLRLEMHAPGPSNVALVVSHGRLVTSPIAVAFAQLSLAGDTGHWSQVVFAPSQLALQFACVVIAQV